MRRQGREERRRRRRRRNEGHANILFQIMPPVTDFFHVHSYIVSVLSAHTIMSALVYDVIHKFTVLRTITF